MGNGAGRRSLVPCFRHLLSNLALPEDERHVGILLIWLKAAPVVRGAGQVAAHKKVEIDQVIQTKLSRASEQLLQGRLTDIPYGERVQLAPAVSREAG